MTLTAEQIANAVLRDRRGRGQVFQLRNKIWRWLQFTPWFSTHYPELHDQVNLVDEVERVIRSRWAAKATGTRRKNRNRKKMTEDTKRQSSFDI